MSGLYPTEEYHSYNREYIRIWEHKIGSIVHAAQKLSLNSILFQAYQRYKLNSSSILAKPINKKKITSITNYITLTSNHHQRIKVHPLVSNPFVCIYFIIIIDNKVGMSLKKSEWRELEK